MPDAVVDGVGVGHRAHRREPARGRGARAGRDRLLVLAAGLAQVGVEVDEARRRRTRPATSRTVAPLASIRLPTAATRPSSISRSAGPSQPCAGSTTRPPFSSSRAHAPASGAAAEQQVQDRHAHGDAVRDLVEDDRAGPSATSVAISTPRFIGPGCMTIASGFARSQPRRGQAVARVVLADGGQEPPAIRSSCMRSIMTTSAPSTAASMSCVTGASARSPGREQRGRRRTGAPWRPSSSAARCWSARRGCGHVAQIATFRPSSRPFRWRMVSASSRACVGCSCAPSPALTTAALQWRARKWGDARGRVPDHDQVRGHGLQVARRCRAATRPS